MPEIHGKPEIPEMKPHEAKGFQEIKPKTDMAISEAKDFVKNLFSEIQSSFEKHYVPYEERLNHTPNDGKRGHWEDPNKKGETKFIPSDQIEAGKTAKEALAKFGLDGIEYRHAEPDFSKVAEATVKIENMTEHCYKNFPQADIKCAEQWNASQKDGRTDWKPADVRDWRHENNYSWHERCDTKTMDLVPYVIHRFFGHIGGRAICRVRDNADKGGKFDE